MSLGGRPSVITQEVVEKTKRYLEEKKAAYEALHDDVDNEGKPKVDIKKLKQLPSVADLSLSIGVSRDTIWKHINDKMFNTNGSSVSEQFSCVVREIQALQEKVLLENGMTGLYEKSLVKLVLGKHGYAEAKTTELTGNAEKPIQTSKSISFVVAEDDEEDEDE